VSSVAWGLFLNFTLASALVAPMSGLGFLGSATGSPRFALTSTLLHTLWGVLVAWVYR
jgi:hypothetical protein